jgi:hypothetical protein
MTTQYIYDLVDTWNDGATTFTSIKMNVTDTASNAASLLMDLQVGTVSKAKIFKSGDLQIGSFGTEAYNSGYIVITNTARSAYSGYWGSDKLQIAPGMSFSWGSSVGYDTATLIIRRRGAANLALGAADAAAPVAQTLSVQSVVAGTTNTAGANLTITGSQGTGTGAGGSIIFQVAPLGSSGSAQNALVDALTIGSDRVVTVAANGNTAQIAMADRGTILSMYTAAFGTQALTVHASGGVWINNDSGSFRLGTSQDVSLGRDAANTLALRNGTAAQGFNIYNTYSNGGVDYERGGLVWASNELNITTNKAGSGLARNMLFDASSSIKLYTSSGSYGWQFTTAGHFMFLSDNTQDIGASGATRPRNVYVGTSITPGAGVVVASLPTPSTGMIARVTNALAPTIGSTVVGGGAAYALVNYNGANWTVIGV